METDISTHTSNDNAVFSDEYFKAHQELIAESVSLAVVNTNKTPLGADAWGRNKAVIDHSLFHGVWTFGVAKEMWTEHIDDVEQATFVASTSVDGMLKLQGQAGKIVELHSKRHPRYQPNKGHLYSSSVFLPDYTVACNQDFGIFNEDSGVFFRANAGVLYACRVKMVAGVISTVAEAITLPAGIDLSKGNVYDIQMQWRGVGNIFFYVNQTLVHTLELLGSMTSLSTWNPALPISFRIDGLAAIKVGCADITSEGGTNENRQRGSIDSGELNLTTAELPVIAIRIPRTISYNGVSVINTRDNALRRISGFADANTLIKMYYTRDATQFTGTTWTNYDTLATLDYAFNGAVVLPNGVTNLRRIITRRIAANGNIEMVNPDPEAGDVYMTNGDYIVVTMQSKNATLGGASIEWGAEI